MAANLLGPATRSRCGTGPGQSRSARGGGCAARHLPRDAAEGGVVMTMLADDPAVEAVVYGAGGILDAPALHVSHSTISIALTEWLAAYHAGHGGYVSAPVFGRPAAAEAAKLFVIAAGAADHLDRCACRCSRRSRARVPDRRRSPCGEPRTESGSGRLCVR